MLIFSTESLRSESSRKLEFFFKIVDSLHKPKFSIFFKNPTASWCSKSFWRLCWYRESHHQFYNTFSPGFKLMTSISLHSCLFPLWKITNQILELQNDLQTINQVWKTQENHFRTQLTTILQCKFTSCLCTSKVNIFIIRVAFSQNY